MKREDLYSAPRKSLISELSLTEKTEMSDFESAFLCGLIKMRRPKKILEVGVAGGGTTAILAKTIDMLDMNTDTKLWSVDLSEAYYRDPSKITGFLADGIKTDKPVKRKMLLGEVLPRRLEKIGGDIDFVILDTVHITPGEILDFLAVFPFLSPDACVVLHDIGASYYWGDDTTFATQLLLNTVTADIILMEDHDREYCYPNIGAFLINEDTSRYIENMFSVFTLPWHYMPADDELLIYRDWYKKYYDTACVRMFDIAVGLHKKNPDWVQAATRKCCFGQPLLFRQGSGTEKWFQKGLSIMEDGFAWTDGSLCETGFEFENDIASDVRCTIKLKYVFNTKQHIIVKNMETIFLDTLIDAGRPKFVFEIPRDCTKNRSINLVIELPDAVSPYELGISDDQRTLGIAFEEIVFEEC